MYHLLTVQSAPAGDTIWQKTVGAFMEKADMADEKMLKQLVCFSDEAPGIKTG